MAHFKCSAVDKIANFVILNPTVRVRVQCVTLLHCAMCYIVTECNVLHCYIVQCNTFNKTPTDFIFSTHGDYLYSFYISLLVKWHPSYFCTFFYSPCILFLLRGFPYR